MVKNYIVIVLDFCGMGLFVYLDGGYDKKSQGCDVVVVLDVLYVDWVDVVVYDIGNMVVFVFVVEQLQCVIYLVLMDVLIFGVGLWEEILKNLLFWYFCFYGLDMECLVKGCEWIYFDCFWNEFLVDFKNFDEVSCEYYVKFYV